MKKKTIEDLVVFEYLKIGPVEFSKRKISADYKIKTLTGEVSTSQLIYSYEEEVFNPQDSFSQNLASMIISQVALNYGLFFRKIIFDGLFDDSDKSLILDMIESTSREIYVNKFLFENPFLIDEYKHFIIEQRKKYTQSKIVFTNTKYIDSKFDWSYVNNDKDKHIILSSGGKDSLLTYGLIKEIGKTPVPVFVNESGRHWFTALNSYRNFKENEKNTSRVWTNCDRIYNWMLRNMFFIRKDYMNIRADIYPVRLWTVAVFLFGVLPIAFKQNAGRVLIGDEYDSTQKTSFRGITHYNAVYDQSRYFDNALTRYYLKKGWNLSQFSILRSLSELLIMKILIKRYPNLQQHQVSCHAAHQIEGRVYPCGNCEKCRRIIGMIKALDDDPKRCGYTEEQIRNALATFGDKKLKQLSSDASHLYYLLNEKNLLEKNEIIQKLAKPNEHIMKLRFDNERSKFKDIPKDLRKHLFKIYLEYAGSAVMIKDRKWKEFDLLNSQEIEVDYPFEQETKKQDDFQGKEYKKRDYIWAELSWPEIDKRLKIMDTALLPCGSIEQHGPHLPVDTDYHDAEYLAKRIAEACSDPKPFLLPAIPYGVSYHHEDFKGTLSVNNNNLAGFVYDIGINLARSGIKKIIIINGHGDNAPTLNYAAQMINRDAKIFVCVDSGESSDEDIYKLIEYANDIHSGEIETSTTLATRPHLVNIENIKDNKVKFGTSYLDFSSARGIPWYVRTSRLSKDGVIGMPSKGTVEKGRKIWDVMVAHLVKFVEEIKSSSIEDLFQKKY